MMWTNDAGPSTILRLDVSTGKYGNFDPLAMLPGGRENKSIYDIAADSKNNLYMTEFQNNYIVRQDAKTNAVTYYQAPTAVSRNRRGNMDEQIDSGSPNIEATRSGCSTPGRRSSRSGRCRPSSRSPMT
jgi:streptogramin lyase